MTDRFYGHRIRNQSEEHQKHPHCPPVPSALVFLVIVHGSVLLTFSHCELPPPSVSQPFHQPAGQATREAGHQKSSKMEESADVRF